MSERQSGRRCSICTHREAEQINAALVENESLRNIAKRFGISAAAVFRHKAEHISETMAKAQGAKEAAEVARGDSLLARVESHLSRIERLQEAAETILEEATEHKGKLSAIGAAAVVSRELRGCYELLGKLAGELREQSTTVNVGISLATSPEWIATRGAILRALEDFPDARRAVADAISRSAL